jgi:hypothetical protein
VGVTLYITNKAMNMLNESLYGNNGQSVNEIKKSLAKRLKRPELELIDLNTHEAKVGVQSY